MENNSIIFRDHELNTLKQIDDNQGITANSYGGFSNNISKVVMFLAKYYLEKEGITTNDKTTKYH